MTKLVEQLKQGADQAWESLSEGWREISSRAGGALTRFLPAQVAEKQSRAAETLWSLGNWAFLAADVHDGGDKLTVRIEAPGMRREDFIVELRGDVLSVQGEKPFDSGSAGEPNGLSQCVYGSFRRDVALPVQVKADQSSATYRDGVLRVELKKAEPSSAAKVAINCN